MKARSELVKTEFNNFRFGELNYKSCSNKYITMDRINKNENKIVIKVADCHLLKTKYGYAFIVDKNHVVFLKDWQVSQNWFGNEVLLDRKYFDVKEWGNFENFMTSDKEERTFDYYLNIAKTQKKADNIVKWQY